MKIKDKSFLKHICIIFIIVIFLEIFVFNFKSYRALFCNNQYDFTIDSFSKYEKTDDYIYIEIENISAEIKTLYLSLENVETVEYKFSYTDETSSDFREMNSKIYVQNLESSKYISTHLTGESNKIALKIYSNDTKVNSISINKKIPFNFNIARVFILFLSIALIYSLKNLNIFQVPFSRKNFKQEIILMIIFVLFSCCTYYINNHSQLDNKDYYSYDFVDAITAGHISLNIEPSEKLLNLENPYDFTARKEQGIIKNTDYIWDLALYNGNYYVYFGILPAIILLVPFHLITGNYLAINISILIFSILTAFSLKELLENIFERFFDKVPFKFMIYSLFILLFGSQILVLNGIPEIYELAIISGLFFAITGINFMFVALRNEKLKYFFLASLFLSLAVACRPTMLLVSIIYAIIIIDIVIKRLYPKKKLWKFIFVTIIPYVIIGSLLMYYNYIRFDSIFEFGASYQLTVNDMTKYKNSFILNGIICNLFGLPNLQIQFPFIATNFDVLTYYGYYFNGGMLGGLFMLVPICFSVFFIKNIIKKTENKETCKFIIIFTCVGILMCIFSVIMAGSAARYLADFAWIFIIAGIMSFLELWNIYKSNEAKEILYKVLTVFVIYIVFINFFGGVVSEESFFKRKSSEEYYKLQYMIDFYE